MACFDSSTRRPPASTVHVLFQVDDGNLADRAVGQSASRKAEGPRRATAHAVDQRGQVDDVLAHHVGESQPKGRLETDDAVGGIVEGCSFSS